MIDKLPGLLTKEAILLAMAPAVALAAGYFFELGYANYYGFPQELIRVDLQTTIIAFSMSVFFLGCWHFYFDKAFSILRRSKSAAATLFRSLLISFRMGARINRCTFIFHHGHNHSNMEIV
jgi:hypothetical protein